MKKRATALLLMAAAMLVGCSAYYQPEAESAAGPKVTQVNEGIDEETQSGPEIRNFSPEDMTIESLELQDEEQDISNPEIIIASDIHYLAKELTDFGIAFDAMNESGDGKVVSYIWEITDAFLDAVIERNPQALILAGDLSLEGELFSHEALAQKLERVERAGIDVMVIPGNHDINNSKAAKYLDALTMPAEPTSPELFEKVYGAYGYEEAISRDPVSLSYVYELPDGTWVFMLDSCQYENGAKVGGMIRTGTYEWLETWLETAWNEDRNVIAVAHHNLLDESRIYQNDCMIEHSEQLEQVLTDWDVRLFLSGHLHVQHYRESELYDIEEITTSSLAISPCQYGVLKYFGEDTFDYHTEIVDVTAWAQRKDDPDMNLQDFAEYADSFLQSIYFEKAYRNLAGKDLTEEDRRMMAEYYAYMNSYSIAGKVVEIAEWAEAAPARQMWKEYSRTDIQSMYLDEILEDAVCDYNVFQK